MKKIRKVYVYLVNDKIEDCYYIFENGISKMLHKDCKKLTFSQIVKELNEQNPDSVHDLVGWAKNKTICVYKDKKIFDSLIDKEWALVTINATTASFASGVVANCFSNICFFLDSIDKTQDFVGFRDTRFLFNLLFLLTTVNLSTSDNVRKHKQLGKPYIRYRAIYALCVLFTLTTAFEMSIGLDNIPNYVRAYSKDLDDMIDENASLEGQKAAKEQIIFDGIQSSNQLTDEEKEYMMLLEEYIKENPYIDLDEVYKKLTTVNITECFAADKEYFWRRDTKDYAAFTFPLTNNILYFHGDKLYFYDDYPYGTYKNYEKDIFVHEYYHLIGGLGNSKRYKHLDEGFTEYLTYETLTDEEYTGTYNKERLCVRYVMALVGKDKLLEAYSKKDASILDEALKEVFVFGSMEKVERFGNLINSYCENKIGINELLGFLCDNITPEYLEKIRNVSVTDVTIREYDFMHTKKLK